MAIPSYEQFFPAEVQRAAAYPPPGSWFPATTAGTIKFNAGYPFPESVELDSLQSAMAELLSAEGDWPLMYSGSRSFAELPELLRARCAARGFTGEAILPTFGGCQALDLAARALLCPADAVAVEAPTYMEALEILRNYTPNLIGYAMDEEGLDVAAMEADLARRRSQGLAIPKLLYAIPNFQNPTGRTMSLTRRKALLALAGRYNFLILEDDAYGELHFGEPVPTLQALDTEGRVVYLGSLSKTIAPGVRVGWALGPAIVIQRMSLFKKDLENPLIWGTTTRYLRRIDYPARLAWLRRQYQERCDFLLGHLERNMPDGAVWTHPAGGYFIWVTLPEGLDAGALLDDALAAGVAYVPGQYFYINPEQGRRELRLSYSRLPFEQMERGAALLGELFRKAAAR